MNKKTLTALIITAFVVIGGGVGIAMTINSNDKKAAETAAMMKKEEAIKVARETATEGLKMDHNGEAMEAGHAMVKGSYTEYAAAKLANAEKGDVVLFFHAPWCPTCREADSNFTSSTTPEGLTLLKTDYDSSQDLKKKYGVTYQHTFVQVDADGNLIKKWSGSNTYDAIEAQLQ